VNSWRLVVTVLAGDRGRALPKMVMTAHSYTITVKKEGKKYYAYSDTFPGVYGLGETVEEARRSILEAMRLYVEQGRKNHKRLPPSRDVYAETVTLVVD